MKPTLTLIPPGINNKLKCFLFGIIFLLFSLTNGKAQTPCTLPAFPASSEIIGNAPEAAGYNLAYKLVIPQADQHWASQTDIPYSVNNTAALASTPFTRIAYYMKLQSSFFGSQWVWVSMDAFTNNINLISIPTGSTIWQQIVHHMNIINYTGENKTGIDGNLEFWSNCYTAANSNGVPGASDDNFDFGDMPTADTNCYGSFQVHDFNAMQTVFAYNGWAFAGNCDDLGIGSWSGASNPDWTLTANACAYDVSELYVFVNSTAPPASCKSATLYLDTTGTAFLTPDMVSNSIAGSCGILSVSISKNTFSCSDKGTNSINVTVTDVNNNSTSCTATVIVKDTIPPVITVTGGISNLGCNPSTTTIQAAFGTATVKDNCAGATLTSTDSTVVTNGCAYSQTRTWTATDASGNTATAVSRTVSWTVDITPPVITATGSTLSLGCTPTSAAIEAALGTATATDNCGLASLTFVTSSATTSGNSSLETRTWTATDACGNHSTASRTVSWITNCNHFYENTVTCNQFLNGAPALSNICYKYLLNAVTSASPSSFFYYTTVTAPAVLGANGSFCVDVTQTKSISSFKFYSINKITASGTSCNVVATGSEVSSGQGRVTITGATPGTTYTIAVNYNPSSLAGSAFPLLTPAPTCTNTFTSLVSNTGSAFGSGVAVSGSQGSISAQGNCSASLLGLLSLRPEVSTEPLNVSAEPNPSATDFNLIITSNTNAPVSVRIFDVFGKLVQSRDGVAANTTLKAGSSWPSGTYFVEVVQGNERKIVKIIKAN